VKLLFVILTLTGINIVKSSDCSQYKSSPLEENHRAYGLLESLQQKISFKQSVSLCVLDIEKEEISEVETCCYPWKKIVIIATRYTLDSFSDSALRGVLAHELGHICLNTQGNYANPIAHELEEQKVDAFAIKLVGEISLKDAYLSHTNDKALAARRVLRAQKLIKSKRLLN
jgi:hypothetical protein